jgi:hypothetical protein
MTRTDETHHTPESNWENKRHDTTDVNPNGNCEALNQKTNSLDSRESARDEHIKHQR